jgi:acyl-CoA thioester hydrolase
VTTAFRRRIEHVDTDASGVVHFSRYVSLMETVALEFLEEHEVGLTALAEHGVGLAVTQLQVSYSRPLTYRDVVVGQAHVEHVGGAKFRATAVLSRDDNAVLATGSLTFAAVDPTTGSAVPLPAALRQTLKGIAADAGLDAGQRAAAAPGAHA